MFLKGTIGVIKLRSTWSHTVRAFSRMTPVNVSERMKEVTDGRGSLVQRQDRGLQWVRMKNPG